MFSRGTPFQHHHRTLCVFPGRSGAGGSDPEAIFGHIMSPAAAPAPQSKFGPGAFEILQMLQGTTLVKTVKPFHADGGKSPPSKPLLPLPFLSTLRPRPPPHPSQGQSQPDSRPICVKVMWLRDG